MSAADKAGFAREILFLTQLSERIVAAGVAKPKVEMGHFLGGVSCTFYVWGSDDWNLPDEARAEAKRIGIETEIAKIVDLFPGATWEKNDPTDGQYNESYYQLKCVWEDVQLKVLTGRSDVCERVVVLEHDVVTQVPDPEMVEKIPLVTVTEKKQVVEWQCNAALAEKTAPVVTSKKEVTV